MRSIKPIQKVIDSFEVLPGIGPKTAARLAYYLLNMPQSRLEEFGRSLFDLKKKTKFCGECGNVGESQLCPICLDSSRDKTIICVVETSLDLLAIENADGYEGIYHVLGGVISPLNNIGPDDLAIASLLKRLRKDKVKELILAMNPNMEGEATAMYISGKIREELKIGGEEMKISRIGRGLPVGADVEYADGQTLLRALEGRREV